MGVLGLIKAGGRVAVGLFLFLLAGMSSGCALLSPRPMPRPPAGQERVLLPDVPFFAQEAHQCGPAALAMALSWSGLAVTPEELTAQVYTPGRQGSLQNDLITAARRHGRLAYPVYGAEALLAELGAGHPVIVLLNLGFSWSPKWHYAVVVGYDQPAAEIVMRSGSRAAERLAFRVFGNTWRRGDFWGLVVLAPGRMPATVAEAPYIDAVVGLEKARQWSAATIAYRAAADRWPQSFAAWLGLGNSRYFSGDLAGAEAAFREGCRLRPQAGSAWNNLAQVLWEQGQGEEALAAAERAVRLGGPLAGEFAATLAGIRAGLTAGK